MDGSLLCKPPNRAPQLSGLVVTTGLGQGDVCESLLRGQVFVWINVKWRQKEQKKKRESPDPCSLCPVPQGDTGKVRRKAGHVPHEVRRVVHNHCNSMSLSFLFGAGCDSGCRDGLSVLALLRLRLHSEVKTVPMAWAESLMAVSKGFWRKYKQSPGWPI